VYESKQRVSFYDMGGISDGRHEIYILYHRARPMPKRPALFPLFIIILCMRAALRPAIHENAIPINVLHCAPGNLFHNHQILFSTYAKILIFVNPSQKNFSTCIYFPVSKCNSFC
jgi:hypothetical protein